MITITWRGIDLEVNVYEDTYLPSKEDVFEVEEAFTKSGDDLMGMLTESAQRELQEFVEASQKLDMAGGW